MKTCLTVALMVFSTFASTATFASSCEQAAESAATEKFRNLEYGCYGNARLVEKLNSNTMRVTVDAIGGSGACVQKVYDVKFKDSGRTCNVISVTRIGMGGI
jgi:hypothetical protein